MTNYLHWHAGMKVVCISDNYKVEIVKQVWFGWRKIVTRIPHNLNKGEVYTITGIVRVPLTDGPDMIGIWVAEAQHFGGPFPIPFPAQLFREIEKRKTDISIFTDMLVGKPQKVDA